MNQRLIKAGCLLGFPLLLTGCIDNKYDLSDIDTTTEIKVNNLTLPINLDVVTLNDIINVDDDSKIKIVTIDGKEMYAVTESGSIDSDPINIPSFSAPAPTVAPAHADFKIHQTRAVTLENYYDLNDFTSQIVDIKATGIDPSVVDITAIDMKPLLITVNMTSTGFGPEVQMEFSTLQLEFLKGLTFKNLPSNYNYDPKTGLLTITNLACPNHQATISLEAVAIDFTASETKLVNHTFDFVTEVKPRDGRLKTITTLSEDMTAAPVSSHIDFTVTTTVSDLNATTFSGIVEYNLEGNGLNLSPVDLSDIPDFLNQEGTDLRLANPQIYLNLTNPVASDHLYYQTGLELVAVRGDNRTSYSPNNGGLIKVQPTSAGPFNFVLSPSMPSDPLSEYANGISHVQFTGLSDILSGAGLPQQIDINLINPGLPRQTVSRFKLDTEIPGITGKYEFFAPLALSSGAVIVYSDTEDGWGDEDMDKLTITELVVEADVTSTVPLKATFTAHPIDRNGNTIPNVTIKGAEINANAANQHIEIRTTGTIKDLDGIKFEAMVTPGSSETLSPDQTISLKNVRARVSGSYTTEL